ncbi:B-cell lymphoma 6 protein-like isoform X16 [Mizuhopecten yessoensis]|uniref:B-cell lymphoma 6 protein-like isoform X16 n=1 Tax=Mizuhopecten yessoensis TaxID=6573 RepID=UPI000B45BCD7|nr:B-cell lymphoma 6 protein-like isoform X16 [Mizuhopecten yessoensis]
MNYQKFYTNGIHSSSLLCQLATMWKSQTLCDAIIKTGNINTKAHRLVLVAACPMLQSMDNASIGSHLEVRLASEIKQDSVNMFLQYLYEGFMMLTEDNHKDIEKIARLLQVDSVIKCCADFCKSLHEKTGLSIYSAGQFKYTSHDMLEFKHVRVSGMQKTVQDSMMKRHSDFQRPNSPGSKRPRMHRPGSPSDGQRGDNMYGHSSHSDSDRVPRLGLGSFPGAAGRNLQPGVIEVIEDSLELVQTEPVERDPVTGRPLDSRPPVQKTVAISVASQVTGGDPDLQIVNVSGVRDSSSSSTSRTHLSTATHTTSTPIARDSRGSSAHSSFSSQQSSQSMRSDIPMTSSSRVSTERAMPQMPRPDIQRSMQNQFASDLLQQQQKQSTSQYPSIPQALIDMDFTANKQKSSDVFPTSLQKATDVFPTSMPKPSDIVFPGMPMGSQQNSTPMAQSKPFAAGSAGQANQSVPVHINTSSSSSSPITSLPPVSPVIPEASLFGLSASSPSSKSSQPTTSRSESMERPSSSERLKEERPPTAADLIGPDISIVKIESTDKDETGVLDMYVDTGDDGEVHPHGMEGEGDQTYEGSDYDVEEPPGEMEGSNEGSNLSGDQNAWYLNTMKGQELSVPDRDISLGQFNDPTARLGTEIPCFRCGQFFLCTEDFRNHPCVRDFDDKVPFLNCSKCNLLFSSKAEKQTHENQCTDESVVVATCNVCQKTFRSMWGFRCHQKSHERSQGNTDNCHKCSQCGKFFTSGSHLRRHLKNHSEARPFVCAMCGKSYKQKYDLKTHSCLMKANT